MLKIQWEKFALKCNCFCIIMLKSAYFRLVNFDSCLCLISSKKTRNSIPVLVLKINNSICWLSKKRHSSTYCIQDNFSNNAVSLTLTVIDI